MIHKTIFLFFFFLIFKTFSCFSGNEKKYGERGLTVQETAEGIVLSNGVIELKFLKEDSGFGLYSLKNAQKKHEFLVEQKKGSLWEVTFKHTSNRLVPIDNHVVCDRTYTIEKADNDSKLILHLYWKGITLEAEEKVVNVHATVRLDQSSLSYWQIDIENNSRRYGTWEVIYPSIKGLRASEEEDVQLAFPDFGGALYKNPIKRILEKNETDPRPPMVMHYPSARCTMQYSTLFEGKENNGLYFATHDGQANVKKYGYNVDENKQSLNYGIKNYPENMGIPGIASSYKMPYEAIVGVYEGDWITASKIYREWAVSQKWCAKGKLSQRKDIPAWYLNTPVWFVSLTDGLASNKMIPLAKYLDVPVAFQWYCWTENPFDTYYPDYFPTIAGFPKMVKQFQNEGIRIVPYINSRIWDMNSKSWKSENPQAAACKMPFRLFDEIISYSRWNTTAWQDLAIVMDHWADNPFAVMCPTTNVWQNKQSDVITKLASEYGVDGVYMDQTASCQPAFCFDPAHGHPLGGGNHWVEGNRKLVQSSKESARKKNPEIILTTEDYAEPYIDVFDGLLAINGSSIGPDILPMFDYVYSGYCLLYGRGGSSGLSFMMSNAKMFLWGEQLGWFDPNSLDLKNPETAYLKTLCKSLDKKEVKKFLFFGELVRAPKLEGDNPTLSVPSGGTMKNMEMPAISHSARKAEDGALGLVFTNLDSIAHTITYQVDTKQYQLPQNKKYVVKVIDGIGVGKEKSYNSSSFIRTEKMPARSVLVLEIKAMQ